MSHRFDEDDVLRAELAGGRQALVRLIRPSDKALLVEGFQRLSPEGRRRRFFGPKAMLSDDELRYLTEVDQVDHVALGALEELEGGPRGLGVARFVRLPRAPDTAEAAIAVVDDAQGLGLGSLLFGLLMEAARERGIAFIRAEVLADNRPMLALLQKIGDPTSRTVDGNVVTLTLPLPGATDGETDRESPLYRLLRLAAERTAVGRRVLRRLAPTARKARAGDR